MKYFTDQLLQFHDVNGYLHVASPVVFFFNVKICSASVCLLVKKEMEASEYGKFFILRAGGIKNISRKVCPATGYVK